MKYEVKKVKQAGEIRQAYQIAVESNKKYYRAISESGKIYGIVNGHHEIANDNNAVVVDGEYWFENDHYVESTIEEEVDETDYKALYEKEVESNKALLKEINDITSELNTVKTDFDNYKAVVEAFKNL